jgi:hypothetical protein
MQSLKLYTSEVDRKEIVRELKVVAARTKEQAIPLLMEVLRVDWKEAAEVAEKYW